MKKTKYIAKPFPENIKRAIYEAQNGYCKNCLNPIHSTHHKLPNNKSNRAKFKHFLNSPMNGVGLCIGCHSNHAGLFKITTQEAEVYEEWLERFMTDMPFSGITYQKIGRG